MRFYSEDQVKNIVKDAQEFGSTISRDIPMDISGYPYSFDPCEHGPITPLPRNITEEITIRDFYAAFALCGLLSQNGGIDNGIPAEAYEWADEMIEIRERK